MAMNDALLKMVVARNRAPNLGLETYLSAQSGMVGVVGMTKLADAHAEQVTKRKGAEATTGRLNAVIKDVYRLNEGLEPGAEVTSAQVKTLTDAITEQASLPVKNRPPLVESPPDDLDEPD